MSVEARDNFDMRLELELRGHAASYSGRSPLAAQAQYHALHLQSGRRLGIFATAATLVSAKAAVAMIVVAAAVGAAGAEEALITGSGNPADWGLRLVQQVQSCATELVATSSGRGACLSSFAQDTPTQIGPDRHVIGRTSSPPATKRGGGPPAIHPGGGPPASDPGGGPPASHPGAGQPTSNPHKPTPTPDGKKPKTQAGGGPFGGSGPPTNRDPDRRT